MIDNDQQRDYTEEAHVEAHEEFTGDPSDVNNWECALCRKPVGLATRDAEIPSEWRSYWAVWLDGDTCQTHFCEDCVGWLLDVGPALQSSLH